ncbi:MAG: DUF1501 domain-containing protein [Verrucomicrobia bacterium]|nr:MAG: DUF1501 domain-containing protein [Verrucomicrobiota bacterium]PYJ99476.1 MAG: DUF1501 domain-containing protein [Verrucomicrobiota bacterium]
MTQKQPHILPATSRRDFLTKCGCGFGGLAFGYLLGLDGLLARAANMNIDPLNPLAPRPPHLPARAKSVIWLFMEGGPSHLDLFDPKPALEKLAGQPMPESFGKVITAMGTANNSLMPSKRSFKQHGECGIWVSDWLPNIAQHTDEMAVIRSCWADGLNHVGSVCQMNTGDILAGRPSLGSWTTYGLGTANENLPTFVVMADGAEPVGGPKNWSAGFLPATFEGTQFRTDGPPIFHLSPPGSVGEKQQRSKLDLLAELNRHFAADKPEDTELAARLNSYELAYRMQAAAPHAVDLSGESELTKKLYGMDEEPTRRFGTLCLLARRLVERGVRFVQLYCGSNSGWDAHVDLEENHSKHCKASDKPIAGLLTDLKARGLLDDTLVVWAGEFGRTPFNEKGKGRDHNPWGFTMWMAGGGVKAGTAYGATDEIGLRAVEGNAHVHDIHATILRLLGMEHQKLTFLHNGRDERPTINGGEVITDIIS